MNVQAPSTKQSTEPELRFCRRLSAHYHNNLRVYLATHISRRLTSVCDSTVTRIEIQPCSQCPPAHDHTTRVCVKNHRAHCPPGCCALQYGSVTEVSPHRSPAGTVDASTVPGLPTPTGPELPQRSAEGTVDASTEPGFPRPICAGPMPGHRSWPSSSTKRWMCANILHSTTTRP